MKHIKQQAITTCTENTTYTTEFLYAKNQHLAAVHLFMPNGRLYSYNGPAHEFPIAAADQRNWDLDWFGNYE